jgi:hypothetical protein
MTSSALKVFRCRLHPLARQKWRALRRAIETLFET